MTPAELGLPEKFTAFRPGQLEIAQSISSRSPRFELLSSPTGSGKSIIYMAAAQLYQRNLPPNYSGRTVIVTKTRILQDQLEADFRDMGLVEVRAKDNYGKPSDGDNYGLLQDTRYIKRTADAARASTKYVVTNYAYWMRHHYELGTYDLLIMDEAHTVPDELLEFSVARFKPESRKRFEDPSKYVIDEDYRDDKGRMRAYRIEGRERMWARAERHLFRDIPKVLLVSGVLQERVADYLGIPETDYRFQEYASHFDYRRRPLIYMPTARVDNRIKEGSMRQLVNRVDRIVDKHAVGLGEKGITHTVSFERAKEMVARSGHVDYRQGGLLLTHDSRDTKVTVELFKRVSGPLVLVSPSVEEGYDFPMDECRFQIIVKVPFVYSKTPAVKARTKSDKRYLEYLTAMRIIQQVGRGMRSPDDECVTYILDDHWSWFKGKNKDLFPSWFRKAWKEQLTL